MRILSIDVGAYSVKFLESRIERRHLYPENISEIVIDEYSYSSKELTLQEKQIEILQDHIPEEYEGKVILQVPNNLLISRYLLLPTTAQKKVSMMIPFQLDDTLPFSTEESHYVYMLSKKGTNTSATISITNLEDFQDYYNGLKGNEVTPSILTSELFIMQAYIAKGNIDSNSVVVNIGHTNTSVYFIHEGMIVSNHTSYTAGKMITEVISKSYNISFKDAELYKHENAFFLTKEQYDLVDDNQKEFADLMRKIITPLIQKLIGWELGYRVKHGVSIDTVYITGGSSQITNIDAILEEALNKRVEYLPLPKEVVDIDENIINSLPIFYLVTFMSLSQQSKYPPPNFLQGQYVGRTGSDLPLHSISFISFRAISICILLFVLLIIDRSIFLNPKISKLDKINRKLMKSADLNISSKKRRYYRRSPKKILSIMKKKEVEIDKEIKYIMEDTAINAITPLAQLSQTLKKNKAIDLIKFDSDGRDAKAIFKAKTAEEIVEFNKYLSSLGIEDKSITYKRGSNSTLLSFKAKD